MRVLQHLALFILDNPDDQRIADLTKQVERMGQVIPGVICITFKENKTDFYNFKKLVGPVMKQLTVVDFWQDNFPEFAMYGHTMMSKSGPASAQPGGFNTK